MRDWHQYPLNRSLNEHACAWDALLMRLEYANPLLQSAFIDSLLRYFGDGTEVLWQLGEENAIEAMAILKPDRFGVWTTFMPGQAQIGPLLARDVSVFSTLFFSMPRSDMQIDLLSLDPKFGGVCIADHGVHNVTDHDLTMSISLRGDFEAYCASRSKKLISNIRRYQSRAEKQGIVSRLLLHEEPSAIQEALERYCVLESAGWKGKQGTALSRGGKQHRFYEDVLVRFARYGKAFVYELWFDDALVASRLCIAAASTVVTLKTAYSEADSALSPGRLLLMALIELQFSKNRNGLIEFYTNATPDQLSWATGKRWISHHTLYRNEPCRVLLDAGKILLRTKNLSSVAVASNEMQVLAYSRLTDLPQAVRDAMLVAESANPEQGHDWYANFIQAVVPDDDGVRIYSLFENDVVLAALPVRIVKNGYEKHIEALGNFYTSLFQPFVSEHLTVDGLAILLRNMIADNGSISCIRLSPMDADSHTYRQLRSAMSRAKLAVFSFFCFGNWYLPVNEVWSNYLAARGEQLKNTLKRRSRDFRKAGGTLEVITSLERVEDGIAAYESVYASSWKTPEPYPEFVPGLIRMLAGKGWLRLGVASLEGRAIAAQVWIVTNGKASIFKLAYDEAFKNYSPGSLVTELLMRHVIEVDQVLEVDYLIGDDPYKAGWMSHRRERWGMVAYNLRSATGVFGVFREMLGRLLKPLFVRIKERNESHE